MNYVAFKNEEDRYAAYGSDVSLMPVYEILSDSLQRTRMMFPACFKFMPYAEITQQPDNTTMQEILKRHGKVVVPDGIREELRNA